MNIFCLGYIRSALAVAGVKVVGRLKQLTRTRT